MKRMVSIFLAALFVCALFSGCKGPEEEILTETPPSP